MFTDVQGGQMRQSAGLQPAPSIARERTIYDEHADAVREWQNACTEFVMARDRRAAAEQQLHGITKQLAEMMQAATGDPTGGNGSPPHRG